MALDYLSCGLDPNKCTIFLQSEVPELSDLTFYYMNLVTLSRLQRNPTIKQEIIYRNFENSIPVGDDQLPMIEQTREIVRTFNRLYGETLIEPNALLPENTACHRLPGTDGQAKMSKSIGNCIYLADSKEEVKRKVMGMFTDPNHLSVKDPGVTEGNPVFIYLSAFSKDKHFKEYFKNTETGELEYKNLEELKAHYERGGLGDMKVKKFLNYVLDNTLDPIRARRHELENHIPEVYKILFAGSEKARKKASKTLAKVKNAIGLNYRNDFELINSQIKTYVIHVKRGKDPNKVLSTNNYLASLTVSVGLLSPEFDREKELYVVYLPYEVDSIEINATVEDTRYGILNVDGPSKLSVGNNEYQFSVTAENEEVRTYKVIVVRAASLYSENNTDNTYLKELRLENGKLSKNFDKNVHLYEYTKKDNFNIIAIPEDENSNVSILEKDGIYVITVESSNSTKDMYILVPKDNLLVKILVIIGIVFTSSLCTIFVSKKLDFKKIKKLFKKSKK